jgi:hypothetical protein
MGTISRRQALASIPAVAMTTAMASHDAQAADDPVFAAIERHREALRALSTAQDDANAVFDWTAEAARDAAYDRANDALIDWLKTAPTTMAGVLATLDYAASAIDDDRTVLSDMQGGPDFELVQQFPAMIAAALRKLGADKQL